MSNQYKLLIVKNRFTGKINISSGLEWFKKNTPVEMTTEEIVTDFDVTTEKVSNATFSGVICGDDIYQKLRTVIPEGKYHAVVFIYGNQLDGIRVNVSKSLPLYPGTDLIQLCHTTDGGKKLNHEIFHTFIHRLQRQQIMVDDPMDIVPVDGVYMKYFNDSDLDAVPSNRSIALERIKPYWDKITNIMVVPPLVVTKYKYFSMSEFTDNSGRHTFSELDATFRTLLDKMRSECGFPFKITSGYRTDAENRILADAVPDSSHTSRLAVDIYCIDSAKRDKIINVAKANGIRRIGIGANFVHIDIDSTKPQDVLWTYYK
jgi:hypothetical protein